MAEEIRLSKYKSAGSPDVATAVTAARANPQPPPHGLPLRDVSDMRRQIRQAVPNIKQRGRKEKDLESKKFLSPETVYGN